MKVIQMVSISCQEVHDSILELLQKEFPYTKIEKGNNITNEEGIKVHILACSKHHVQLAYYYPEGIYFKDIQVDSLTPCETQIEVNASFIAKSNMIQLLSYGYELFYQFKFKRLTREKIKKIEKKHMT